MVKTERLQAEHVEPTPGSAWAMAILAWFIPGAGHLVLRKWGRAALMGGAVWLSFIVGRLMGGHLFDLSAAQGSSILLQFLPMVANFGAGALYLFSWLLGVGFGDNPQEAARTTYEYGTHFLLIAGLLNYLTMLDAFDIAAGRRS